MMVQTAYKIIQETLDGISFFSDNFGLAQIKEDDKGVSQPVYWTTKWNRIPFNKMGVTYFRENGSATTETDYTNSFTACNPIITIDKPIKLIALTKRDLLTSEGQYAQDELAQKLIKDLTVYGGSAMRAANMTKLAISATSYETNSETVLNNEFSNIPVKDFQYYDVVISIDLVISVAAKQSCIDDICE